MNRYQKRDSWFLFWFALIVGAGILLFSVITLLLGGDQ